MIKDKTGKRFGRLKVLGDSGLRKYPIKYVVWGCLCDCGNFSLVASNHLSNGDTNSCGCLKREISSARMSRVAKLNRKYSKIEAKKQKLISARLFSARGCRDLSNNYIKTLLVKRSILNPAEIPPGLIQLKRAEITARRLLNKKESVK